MSENRRVVVTGMGVISPVGSDMDTAWNNLIAGYNGIGPITYFDTTNYKAKLGAQVKDFDPMQYMDKSETLRSDKYAQYAMGAAVQAKRASFGQTYYDKYAPKPAHPERLTTGFYRVRKTWADKKSQLGAYRLLSNAKGKADKNPGYFVFTDDGEAIYPTETTDAAEEEYTVHTVVPGDTLWKIAEKYLGKGTRYPEVKELNGLTSNVIYRGMKLKIPN